MNNRKLIAKAERFAAGCSRNRMELQLVDALKKSEWQYQELQATVKPIMDELAEALSVIDQMRQWAKDSIDPKYGTLSASYINNLLNRGENE